jgi:hypothetical protein
MLKTQEFTAKKRRGIMACSLLKRVADSAKSEGRLQASIGSFLSPACKSQGEAVSVTVGVW